MNLQQQEEFGKSYLFFTNKSCSLQGCFFIVYHYFFDNPINKHNNVVQCSFLYIFVFCNIFIDCIFLYLYCTEEKCEMQNLK
jgi:hypothetical protein